MRLLQIVQKPQRRGAEVFAHQLSQVLQRQGHDVYCVYLYPYSGDGALPVTSRDCVLDGIEQHYSEKLLGGHPRLLGRLLDYVAQVQPDVVQVNGARTVKYGALAHMNHRQKGWALIYRNIGNPQDWVHGIHYRMFYKHLIMPQLDGVVGVSQTTLDNLKEFYKFDIPTKNIPRGVDPALLLPTMDAADTRVKLNTPIDAKVLIYVGSLTPEKRLDRLLAVFERVMSQVGPVYLWVVGDGPLRNTLEGSVRSFGLEQLVRFVGIQHDVANYLVAANLFVLCSDTEGIPGVILEAAVVGIPSVATRVGGIPECVVDGETGLLVEPQDYEKFAEAIVQLLQDPQQSLAMGRKAKTWVCDHFDMNQIAQKYLEFYEIVRNHKGRSGRYRRGM